MSILGIGVDIVETQRIEHSLERFGDRFLRRVFTQGEIDYCQSMKYPARHFAARFAAKEAASKAFGTGIGKSIGWRDIDVHREGSGQPFIVFAGSGEQLARDRGVSAVWVSLSHTEHHAVATVVLESQNSDAPLVFAKAGDESD